MLWNDDSGHDTLRDSLSAPALAIEQSIMSFRLEEHQSLPSEIVRVASEQIEHAARQLTPPIAGGHAVHEARKAFKKIRALLRLVRDEIGDDVYAEENTAFRDMGRHLSGFRDSTVLVHTVDWLLAHGERTDALHELRAALDTRGTIAWSGIDQDERVIEVRGMLDAALKRLPWWPVERDRFAAIADGLKRTYKRGRLAYGNVVGDSSIEHLHDWRKQVKYLWYHLRLLKPMWPDVLTAMTAELRDLSEDLGRDHDLAVLAETIELHPLIPDVAARQAVIERIERERYTLQQAAKSRGARIYSERPKAFVERLKRRWNIWRSNGNGMGSNSAAHQITHV